MNFELRQGKKTSGALIFHLYIKSRYKVIRAIGLTLSPWGHYRVKRDTSTHKQRVAEC